MSGACCRGSGRSCSSSRLNRSSSTPSCFFLRLLPFLFGIPGTPVTTEAMAFRIFDRKPVQLLRLREYSRRLKNGRLEPLYVQWIATHKCNFNCPCCGGGGKVRQAEELTTEEIKKAVDSLAGMGCELFSVAGGEAVLREDIFEVLAHVKARGMAAGIVTNGYAVEEYASRLEKLGLDSVLVSIDGYRENHDRIRDKAGSYQKCLRSLQLFRQMRVPVVATYTVISEENVHDVPLIAEEARRYGSMRHGVQLIIPEGRAAGKKNPPWLVAEALRTIISLREKGFAVEASPGFGYLGELEGKARPYHFFCGCGWDTFTIMANGDIMGCPLFEHPELKEANLRGEDIPSIWKNRFHKFRKLPEDGLPAECRGCASLSACRGGCWQFRASGGEFCFKEEARKVFEEFYGKRDHVRA